MFSLENQFSRVCCVLSQEIVWIVSDGKKWREEEETVLCQSDSHYKQLHSNTIVSSVNTESSMDMEIAVFLGKIIKLFIKILKQCFSSCIFVDFFCCYCGHLLLGIKSCLDKL